MFSIIYEDENLAAVNKPAGVLTHPLPFLKAESQKLKTIPTLTDWILDKYPEIKNVGDQPKIRPGLVHRLDRDVSGIILIAKNQDTFNELKKLFQTRQIKKTYLALVWGRLKPEKGLIEIPIGIKSGSIKRTVWQKRAKHFKEAITEYRVLNYLEFKENKVFVFAPPAAELRRNKQMAKSKWQIANAESQIFSLLEVFPKTGRTHQIRIHLASLGHPIVGDKIYGFKKLKMPFGLGRLFLHAASLEFTLTHKSASTGERTAGRRFKLEAELPAELQKIISQGNIIN